jgi:hypothetical protein
LRKIDHKLQIIKVTQSNFSTPAVSIGLFKDLAIEHRDHRCDCFFGLLGHHRCQCREGDDRMKRLLFEMKVAAKQAPRLYFAPFVGAVIAMKKEVRALRQHTVKTPTKSRAPKTIA